MVAPFAPISLSDWSVMLPQLCNDLLNCRHQESSFGDWMVIG